MRGEKIAGLVESFQELFNREFKDILRKFIVKMLKNIKVVNLTQSDPIYEKIW